MAQFTAQCPHCKQQFNAQTEWIGQNTNCPTCGKIFTIQQNLCSSNPPVISPIQYQQNFPIQGCLPKSKMVFILLGLFLGCLGIHNFYLGYNKKGVIQLLVTLLLGWLGFPLIAIAIWVIIEICTIRQDSNGCPLC